MQVGISTACLYPMETGQAMERMIRQGFRSFEVFFNTASELEPDYVARLHGMARQNGGEIRSYHLFTSAFEPLLFFSDYPARFADSLQLYRRWAAVMARTGARVAVLHGAGKDSRLGIPEYCRRFEIIARSLREEGVTLAQENVARCLSGSAANIRRMRQAAGPGAMRFVLDVKQALRAGEDPLVMRAAMGEDLPGFIRALRQGGYDGALTIEVYRGNFGAESELGAARRKLERLAG